MGFVVKEVQPTPNPNASKFVLDRPISGQPISFLNPEQGQGHPLASKLFAIQGVASVLILGDFVTVNKEPTAKWPAITRKKSVAKCFFPPCPVGLTHAYGVFYAHPQPARHNRFKMLSGGSRRRRGVFAPL
jgi:hypothetical protein